MTDGSEGSPPICDEPIFMELLTREVGRASRYRDFFTVAFLGADSREGRSGVELRDLEAPLSGLLRSTDLVGRIPDAIAVLLVNTSAADSVAIMERVRTRVGDVAQGRTVSIGLACFPRDGTTSVALLERARTFLLKAAAAGGNRVLHTEASG